MQMALFNTLKAYSILDEEIGYCQGMSFVMGLLLMHVRDASWAHPTISIALPSIILRFFFLSLSLHRPPRPKPMSSSAV